jgi:hypothetical protein
MSNVLNLGAVAQAFQPVLITEAGETPALRLSVVYRETSTNKQLI